MRLAAVPAPAEADAGPATFDEVYRRYRARVVAWALRYCAGRGDLAEDVAHDAFLKLHRQLPRLAEVGDVQAWLYRVTANEALSRLRRERSLGARLWLLFSGVPTLADGPEHDFERRQEALLAQRALKALPDKERVVICMWALDGLKQRDIAKALELSEGYVSKLLARGQERLRARGWEVSDDA